MAAAKILGGGTPNPRLQCVTLLPKPYFKPAQWHYFPTPTKIRPFSVRACGGRAINNKLLLSDGPKRSMITIDFRGTRVVKSNQAQKAFVADTNGLSQVWDDGVSPKNLTVNLLRFKVESLLGNGKKAAAFLVKVSFWVSLAASCVSGLIVASFMIRFLAYRNSLSPAEAKRVEEFSLDALTGLFSGKLIEHVFSFAFGDGDPNQGLEEKRWMMIGQYIALNGGIVTAEELAPYLDLKTTEKMADDSYMLPVLQKFDGQPKVDAEGNILYHFPSVHCSPPPRRWSKGKEYVGRWADQDVKVSRFLKETEWEFSKLDGEKIKFVNILLHYNLFCALLWIAVLRIVSKSYPSYLFGPLLLMYVIYAGSFLAMASVRASFFKKRNAEIVIRNKAREERAKAVELPVGSLKRKLLSARTMAWRASIGNDRIVYGSESDFYAQEDFERWEWDRRFNEKQGLFSLFMFELKQVRFKILKMFE